MVIGDKPMTNKCIDADSIRTFRTGGLELFSHFDSRLGISKIVKPYKRKGVPLDGIVKTLVSSWTIEPASVKQTIEQANENFLLASEELVLKTAYRGLETLGKNSYEMYAQIFARVKECYKIDLSTIYNDTTSAFFNGQSCAIAKKGFSKDHRPDKPQISISLAVTSEFSVPVMHSVAEGNRHDSAHFADDFNVLCSRVPKGTLFVFDKGTDSKENREEIRKSRNHFLTAAKIHEPMKKEMRRHAKHLTAILEHKSGDKVHAAEWEDNGIFYTLFLDERRKKSDAKKRGKKIAKAEAQWNELNNVLMKKGAKALQRKLRIKKKMSFAAQDYVVSKSVAVQQRLVPKKDMLARLKEGEDLDGMFVLVSDKKMSAKKALRTYRKKAAIEKMFSDMKSSLRLRPLRVWNEDEVKGLVLLKVICALLLSLLQLERSELRDCAKSTIVLMLKNLTVVVKLSKNGTKTVLGYDCRHAVLAKTFRLKS